MGAEKGLGTAGAQRSTGEGTVGAGVTDVLTGPRAAPASTFDAVQGLGGRLTSDAELRASAFFETMTDRVLDAVKSAGAKIATDANAREQDLLRKLSIQITEAMQAVGEKLSREAEARDSNKAEELQQFEAHLAAEIASIQKAHEEAILAQSKAFAVEREQLLRDLDSAIADRTRATNLASYSEGQLAELARRYADYTELADGRYAEMSRRAEHAEAIVTRVMASISWRVTKPFRVVGRGLHRAVRGVVKPRARAADDKPRRQGRVLSSVLTPFRWLLGWLLDPIAAWLWPLKRRPFHYRQKPTVLPAPDINNEEWLAEFKRLNGRPLRVLHIGNIANNAYNNAKIQRRFGIEADVLSNDYYHIMACPEWEDATFAGNVGDDMFPDWWNAGIGKYKRPRWFVQGPWDACIRYLFAYTAKAPSTNFLWRWLVFERWMVCHKSERVERIRERVRKWTSRIIRYDAGPANGILWKYWGGKLQEWGRENARKWPSLSRRVLASGRRLTAHGTTADTGESQVRNLYKTQHMRKATRERLASLLGTSDNLPSTDFAFNWWWHPLSARLFRRYDLIQAYATYTAMPFIVKQPYLAYEHGTIRTLPFEQSDQGKLCLATYRAAEAVFVTNTDCLEPAERMNIAPDRIVPLPHAFDSDKLGRYADRFVLKAAPSVPLFIMSSRQHWVDRAFGWSKANDYVYRAMAIVKSSGRHCLLRAVAWGKDVQASKDLIRELGIEDMVEWVPTMRKDELWDNYLSSSAVLDQFDLQALGGVTFEAMMLGRRTISNIDADVMVKFFGEAPPLHNCATPDEIAVAMIDVIDDPHDMRGRGPANRKWMERYHSAHRVVDLQVSAYRTSITRHRAAKKVA